MSEPAGAAVSSMEKKVKRVYRQARREIQEEAEKAFRAFEKEDAAMRLKVEKGEMSNRKYKQWRTANILRNKTFQQKAEKMSAVLYQADETANDIINRTSRTVFAENANWQAYEIEKGTGMAIQFSLHDQHTVDRLLRDEPDLLPQRSLNKPKDMAWNYRNVTNAVTQGILQGESIDKIADRIARETGEKSTRSTLLYARTATTGAQNAGRMEAMEEYADAGIKVQKEWIATLDNRTRDAHAGLDGQVVDVDKPFKSELGDIMYPGDPKAHPGNVYNCRCTLGYVFPDYASGPAQRRAYNDPESRSSEIVGDMTYAEWKAGKAANVTAAKAPSRTAERITEYPEDRFDKEFRGLLAEREMLDEDILRLRREIDDMEYDGIEGEEYQKKVEELRQAKDRRNKTQERILNETDTTFAIESGVMVMQEVGVEYVPVSKLESPLDETEIISRISGGDMTDGSCASLSLCYVGQKAGYDVEDFRGGESGNFFARNVDGILECLRVEGATTISGVGTSETEAAWRALSKMEEGHEYVLSVGAHTTIVRATPNAPIGRVDYLELQSGEEGRNGWRQCGTSLDDILTGRFHASSEEGAEDKTVYLYDVEELGKNPRLTKLYGFINTAPGDEQKGTDGYEK